MNTLTATLREVWGLFVEDLSFTVAMSGCLLLAALAFPALDIRMAWRGPVLFVLLAFALVENVWRSARHA